VGVILINDGEESRLSDELFKDYPYRVDNITIPHGGVSRARNAGIDASKADWIMVCDFDDQFCSTLGLQLLFSAIQEDDKDMYWSHFLEEVVMPSGEIKLLPHGRDVIFVHGKMFRRQWLIDNNIRFCDGLTLHEDVYFNSLAQAVAQEDRIGEIKTNFYLWCHNPQSVGRSYGAGFLIETYDHLMKQRNEVAKEYQRRGMETQVKITVCKTVIDAFYDFQSTLWQDKKYREVYKKNERWFCTFLKRYGKVYAESDARAIAKLAEGSRDFHYKQGAFLMECNTLGNWLNHIMNDVEPLEDSVLDV
jgi:glycosyltransferase involved in cell wall biosynthesis